MQKTIKIWVSSLSIGLILTSCGLFSDEDTSPDTGTEDPTEQVTEENEEDSETIENQENEEDTGESGDQEPEESTANQELSAWMPRLENVVYSYEGSGIEYATYTWNPQFNQDDYYQIVEDNSGTVMAEVYEYRDDQIVRTFSRGETYFRDNFTEIGTFEENTEEEIVLQAPIEVGTTWTNAENDNEITAINHELTVPAGTYNTIEVTTTTDTSTIRRYYAEDVGLVSEVTEAEDMSIESNLESVEKETPEIIPFTVYVPDEQAMGMNTVAAELTLETNDPARIAITELLSGENPSFEEVNILPEGTEINYLFLNSDNIVEVDVSSEFEDNMNAGTTGEQFFVYNLVNTLSDYYGTQDVLLTVDGEPFSGAHMGTLPEGEPLQYNEDMVN